MDSKKVVNREAVSALLQEMAHRHAVDTLRYDGLSIWVVLRNMLWQRFLTDKNPTTKLPKGVSKPVAWWQQVARYGQVWRTPRHMDALFFSSHLYNTDMLYGKTYNRHIDPFLGLPLRAVKFEWENNRSHDLSTRAYAPLTVHPRLWRWQARLFDRKAHAGLEGRERLDALLEEFVSKTGITPIMPEDVIRELAKINQKRLIWQRILSRLKPKAVFLPCYYWTDGYALVAACRTLGIPVADIQHGVIEANNLFYAQWHELSHVGSPFLPDFFWVWGSNEARTLQAENPIAAPKPIEGGNAWIALWKHTPPHQISPRFLATLSQYQRVILVTLQPMHLFGMPIVSPFLLEVMKHAPTSWLWLLRLHPIYKTPEERAEIKRLLAVHQIEHFELDDATDEPLYALLPHVHKHITSFSAVSLEALQWHIATLLIHEEGRATYQTYIQAGVMAYAEDRDTALRYLAQDNVNAQVAETIQTNFDAILGAIQTIGQKKVGDV